MATDEQMIGAADRRLRVLDCVRASIEGRGFPPTLTEISEQLDVDRETIVKDVRILTEAGKLEVEPRITRGIRLVGFDVVLVKRPDPVTV